jgi:alpha-L-fucosidase 2
LTPPFQIDANLGTAAAMLEMLVFSKPGMIKLLPALPDAWRRGRAVGLACRGQISIRELEWDTASGNLVVSLESMVDQTVTVKLPHIPKSIACEPDTVQVEDSGLGDRYRNLRLPAGTPTRLQVGW